MFDAVRLREDGGQDIRYGTTPAVNTHQVHKPDPPLQHDEKATLQKEKPLFPTATNTRS
jgi:hypothetical protein